MADPEVPGGEAEAEPTGTTANATEGQTEGQTVASVQTTGNGADQGGESFFDYDLVKGTPNEPAYKQMQAAHTKKSEQLNAGLDKIKQYDQFMSNPEQSIRAYAQQNGWQLVKGQPIAEDGTPKSYENWDQVMDEAERRVMAKMQPMFGELQTLKKQGVEQALDGSFPDWRTYEDSMMENLQAHPTLVNDHKKLYQMSVPAEVLEAKAMKAALAKIQGTTDSGKIQGQSTTTQQATAPKAAKSFDEAVTIARSELVKRGLKPPRE